MKTQILIEPVEAELAADNSKWRNLYMATSDEGLKHGDLLWDTQKLAEHAASNRVHPELYEYLGAFKEGEQK